MSPTNTCIYSYAVYHELLNYTELKILLIYYLKYTCTCICDGKILVLYAAHC